MLRAKALGANTLTIPVFWNFHAATRHSVDLLSEWRNLGSLLVLAKELDLMVILQIGPFVGAEWDLGGLPAWLLSDLSSSELRTNNQQFLSAVDTWFKDSLFKVVEPNLWSQGGAVVMVQIESHFGSYGDTENNNGDKEYIEHLFSLVTKE